jgi:hypothetical protein
LEGKHLDLEEDKKGHQAGDKHLQKGVLKGEILVVGKLRLVGVLRDLKEALKEVLREEDH